MIEADSMAAAKEKLRKGQIYLTDLIALGDGSTSMAWSPALLLRFTQELAQLLQAGLPLYESLLTIEEKYRRHPQHALFLDLCDHLKQGQPLSVAMKRYPTTFDQIYLSMVQAGEQSGRLALVFDQLAQLLLRGQKLKKRLISTFTYPAFLGGFCLLIVGVLLFFIIPSLGELLEGRDLHILTQGVLSLSRWANDSVPYLLGLGGVLLCALVGVWRHPRTKLFLQEISLKVPFIKSIILHASLVRFSRALSMLLEGGVPLLEGLSLSRKVMKSAVLENVVQEAEQRIMQGQRLSTALQGQTLLPPLVLRVVALAEETGRMQEAFAHLSAIYEEELDKHLAQLMVFLQPVLLMVLGGLVGLVVLSILLPLTDVSSFINS